MEKERCIDAAALLLTAMTQEKQARADQLRAILALAQNYSATTGTTIDGELIDELIEDTTRGGSSGTIAVSEFVGMELGPLMGCSPHQGSTILFETLNLYYRHRPLWDAVQDLSLDANRARKAAGRFGVLTPAAAERAGQLWVQKQHRLAWQGAIDLCDKIIIELDPDMAAEKEAARLRSREVKIWDFHEGTINLTARLDALDAKYVYATATHIAHILHAKPEYTKIAIDVLRAKALGIMAHPALALTMLQEAAQYPMFGTIAYAVATGIADTETDRAMTSADGGTLESTKEGDVGAHEVINTDTGRIDPDPHHCLGHTCGAISVPLAKLQPRVQIYIHLNTGEGAHGAATLEGAATIEGAGTIAITTLTELLDGKQVKITPVLDLNTLEDEHHYRPSRRLKGAIHLTFPQEAFPFSNRSSRRLDLDHTTAYHPSCRDAQTTLGNLAPLSRRTHRAKTAGYFTCHQPTPGQLIWKSPLGFRYTVDKHGTRRLE